MNPMTVMDPNHLQKHILETYNNLRYGMGIITFLFPIAIFVSGKLSGVDLQSSLSAYYWADLTEPNIPRVFFVGGLFAIAAFLYLYKGFTVAENIAFNISAVLGAVVALVPMSTPAWNLGVVHAGAAVGTFLGLVYVVWFRAGDTLEFLPQNEAEGPPTKMYTRAWYQLQYRSIGLVMLVSPLTAVILKEGFAQNHAYVFFIESAAIWAFAWYWLTKSVELKRSSATRRALRGELAINAGDARARNPSIQTAAEQTT